MNAVTPSDYLPEHVSPLRQDAPGAVTSMPSPTKLHHIHIFSDQRYDEMVEYYKKLLNAETIKVNPYGLTFISFDDHDHRVVIIKREGADTKPDNAIGVSHVAFCYASLGELVYVYRAITEAGFDAPGYCVNHGNSTAFYYRDPDGNQVELMMDNFTTLETQDYKRYYQWSEDFGQMSEGEFDPAKMADLYESGMPDTILIDREEVRRLRKEGKL